jgi:hypothetical protein
VISSLHLSTTAVLASSSICAFTTTANSYLPILFTSFWSLAPASAVKQHLFTNNKPVPCINQADPLCKNSDPVSRITGARKIDSGINPTDEYLSIKKTAVQAKKCKKQKQKFARYCTHPIKGVYK